MTDRVIMLDRPCVQCNGPLPQRLVGRRGSVLCVLCRHDNLKRQKRKFNVQLAARRKAERRKQKE